jgi:hypothetical protein
MADQKKTHEDRPDWVVTRREAAELRDELVEFGEAIVAFQKRLESTMGYPAELAEPEDERQKRAAEDEKEAAKARDKAAAK